MIRASFGKTAAGRLLLGAGALAVLMPAIAGCEAGNNAPTLEFHAASAGAQTDGQRNQDQQRLRAWRPVRLDGAGWLVRRPVRVALQRRCHQRHAAERHGGRHGWHRVRRRRHGPPADRRGRQPDRPAAVGGAQEPVQAAHRRRVHLGDPGLRARGRGEPPGPGGAAVVLLGHLLPAREPVGQQPLDFAEHRPPRKPSPRQARPRPRRRRRRRPDGCRRPGGPTGRSADGPRTGPATIRRPTRTCSRARAR